MSSLNNADYTDAHLSFHAILHILKYLEIARVMIMFETHVFYIVEKYSHGIAVLSSTLRAL